jgi:hypothetical protein
MSIPKRSLPSLARGPSGPPTPDEARVALGGRRGGPDGHGAEREGAGVTFTDARGRTQEGVVVCATSAELDVWIGDGRFQRLAPERTRPLPLAEGHPLAEVAADARVFTAIGEGEPVHFVRRNGDVGEGVLVEKCRYGGLVAAGPQILAVSFRRLWPRSDADG